MRIVITTMKKEKISTITMTYNEKKKELTIGNREGEFVGMLEKREFEIVCASTLKGSGLDFQVKPYVIVTYKGNQQSIRME
jgi:alpha-D-xyloside xylohydrolase